LSYNSSKFPPMSKPFQHKKSLSINTNFNNNLQFDGYSTPMGGAVFYKPQQRGTTSPKQHSLNSQTSHQQPQQNPFVVSNSEKVPLTSKSAPATPTGHSKVTPTIVNNVVAMSLEWRIKKEKAQKKNSKAKETDIKRLAARQKQIDIGMSTAGYKAFIEQVPQEKRTKMHPRIPDINQDCSKRSWDGQVRKWRRQLHAYDPASVDGENESDVANDEEDEDDDNEEVDDNVTNINSDEEYSTENISSQQKNNADLKSHETTEV